MNPFRWFEGPQVYTTAPVGSYWLVPMVKLNPNATLNAGGQYCYTPDSGQVKLSVIFVREYDLKSASGGDDKELYYFAFGLRMTRSHFQFRFQTS